MRPVSRDIAWRGGVAALVTAFVTGCADSVVTDPRVGEPFLAKGSGGSGNPTVDAVDPTSAPQDTTLDVRVIGTGYTSGAVATFLLDGKATAKVRTNRTTFVSATEVVANITIAVDAVVDLYDVQVMLGGGKKGIGIEKFAVQLKGNPSDPSFGLSITMGQGSLGTDAIRSDDAANTPYVESASLGAHLAPNAGTLMFWTSQYASASNPVTRWVRVQSTAASVLTDDRIYSNTHVNPGGDDSRAFLGMVPGSTGSAVIVAELHDAGQVQYGLNCDGTGNAATRAVTTRSSDGATWTVTGTTGVHCRKLRPRDKVMTQVGTAGSFSMTMVALQ